MRYSLDPLLDMRATVDQLASIAVFARLQPEQLASLQACAVVQRYQPGEIVMHEGDPLPAQLYALIAGALRVSKTAATGKETILRTLAEGDIFAAPALFGSGTAPATVTVERHAQVLTVARQALLQVIQVSPEIALNMMAVYNQRLQQLHERIHGLVSERAIVRLARFVQAAALEEGAAALVENGGEGADIVELRSHHAYYEVARSIGITYEECVRLFKQLQAVVTYRRGGQITILDWLGLDAIAQGEAELDPAAKGSAARRQP